MTDVCDFIEEELGIEVSDFQRQIIEGWWPPPPPYVPPKQTWQVRARRWFNRVVLRRKPISLSNFDKVLKETYAPALAAQINQTSPLMGWIKKDRP